MPTGRKPNTRLAHGLCVTAESAGGRYSAQSDGAGGRDGARHSHRNPNRRHAAQSQTAPENTSAANYADNTGANRTDAEWPEAPSYFAGLRHIIIDELHALYPNKRGDLLALGLARLNTLAPNLVCTGLSATVAEPDSLRRYLAPQTEPDSLASLVVGAEGAAAQVDILDTKERLPWGSHSALHAMSDVLAAVEKVKTALIFVNTRSQAERVFRELWAINHDNLEIALHHGSLARERGARSKRPWQRGPCAPWCAHPPSIWALTGAALIWSSMSVHPKVPAVWLNASGAPIINMTLLHRLCLCRPIASRCWNAKRPRERGGGRTRRRGVSARRAGCAGTAYFRHGLCGPSATQIYDEVRKAHAYHALSRETFEQVLDFVSTGGYALRSYDRFARLRRDRENPDLYRLTHPRLATRYAMNVGTIVEAPMLKVRLTRAQSLWCGASKAAHRRSGAGRDGGIFPDQPDTG